MFKLQKIKMEKDFGDLPTVRSHKKIETVPFLNFDIKAESYETKNIIKELKKDKNFIFNLDHTIHPIILFYIDVKNIKKIEKKDFFYHYSRKIDLILNENNNNSFSFDYSSYKTENINKIDNINFFYYLHCLNNITIQNFINRFNFSENDIFRLFISTNFKFYINNGNLICFLRKDHNFDCTITAYKAIHNILTHYNNHMYDLFNTELDIVSLAEHVVNNLHFKQLRSIQIYSCEDKLYLNRIRQIIFAIKKPNLVNKF